MQITVNGTLYDDLPPEMNVQDLIVYLKLPKGKLAVERNLEIVPKSLYTQTQLRDKDRIEIVHFIGGG